MVNKLSKLEKLIKKRSVPVYQMSPKAIKTAEEAWQEYKAGKTHSVNSVEELDKLIKAS